MAFARLPRSLMSFAVLLGFCGIATASPVTYNWTSGSVTVTSFVLPSTTNILTSPSNTVPLTGSQVTFDSAVPNVPGFLLAAAGPNTINFSSSAFSSLPLSQLNNGKLIVSNLSITAGNSYFSNGSGSGPNYNVTMNNLSVSGTYQLKSPSNVTLWSGTFTNVQTPGPITGGVTLTGSNSQLTLNGIQLAAIVFPQTLGGQTMLVKGDVIFNGTTPVPLPAGLWLLGSGLFGLSRLTRRRSGAQPISMPAVEQIGSGA